MDALSVVLSEGISHPGFSSHIEQSGRPEHNKQFSSVLAGIAWVPHQAIPAWILTGLTLKNMATRTVFSRGLFLVLLGLLWSVFATMGIAALIATYFLTVPDKKGAFLSSFSPENVGAALPVLWLCIDYLASSSTSTGIDFRPQLAGHYTYFLLVEFLALWGVLYAAHRYLISRSSHLFKGTFKQVFFLSLIVVLIFFGFTHGLQKNASHVPVLILLVATVRMLESVSSFKAHKGLRGFARSAVALLLIGAITPAVELNRAFKDIGQRGAIYSTIKPYGLSASCASIKNYFSFDDSTFYRWLARR